MNNTAKIFAALAIGAAAGAIAGILFAPDKGSETRKKINETGKKLTGEMKGMCMENKEKLNNLTEGIEQKVKETMKEFA